MKSTIQKRGVWRELDTCPEMLVNPVRNSSGALNLTLRGGTPYGAEPGIILKSNPAAEQRGIISNGVKERWKQNKKTKKLFSSSN